MEKNKSIRDLSSPIPTTKETKARNIERTQTTAETMKSRTEHLEEDKEQLHTLNRSAKDEINDCLQHSAEKLSYK